MDVKLQKNPEVHRITPINAPIKRAVHHREISDTGCSLDTNSLSIDKTHLDLHEHTHTIYLTLPSPSFTLPLFTIPSLLRRSPRQRLM